MKTKDEIKAIIEAETGFKVMISKCVGSMKEYTRFRIKKGDIDKKISDEKQASIKKLFPRSFADWWEFNIHNSNILA